MAQLILKLLKEDIINIVADKYDVGIADVDILPVKYDENDMLTIEGFVNITQS